MVAAAGAEAELGAATTAEAGVAATNAKAAAKVAAANAKAAAELAVAVKAVATEVAATNGEVKAATKVASRDRGGVCEGG